MTRPKPNPDPTTALSVRLPADVAERLRRRAEEDRRSVNSTILVAVEAYLDMADAA